MSIATLIFYLKAMATLILRIAFIVVIFLCITRACTIVLLMFFDIIVSMHSKQTLAITLKIKPFIVFIRSIFKFLIYLYQTP